MPYFTSAASIGQTQAEIDVYILRLDEAFKHFKSADPFGIFKKNAKELSEHIIDTEKVEEEKESK